MRKSLRILGMDVVKISSANAAVARAKKDGNPRNQKMTAAQKRELDGFISMIDKARQRMMMEERKDFSDMTNVATAAGHGISTWQAWKRRSNPTSPKFFDLRDFFRAVGLDVRPVGQDAVDAGGTVRLRAEDGGSALKTETQLVVEAMERASDSVRLDMAKAALKVLGDNTHPLGADAEQSGRHVRNK